MFLEEGCVNMIESNRVEFKSELNDKLEKIASAFLNSEGGTLYIGINDDGTPCELQNIDQLQLQISDRLKTISYLLVWVCLIFILM